MNIFKRMFFHFFPKKKNVLMCHCRCGFVRPFGVGVDEEGLSTCSSCGIEVQMYNMLGEKDPRGTFEMATNPVMEIKNIKPRLIIFI